MDDVQSLAPLWEPGQNRTLLLSYYILGQKPSSAACWLSTPWLLFCFGIYGSAGHRKGWFQLLHRQQPAGNHWAFMNRISSTVNVALKPEEDMVFNNWGVMSSFTMRHKSKQTNTAGHYDSIHSWQCTKTVEIWILNYFCCINCTWEHKTHSAHIFIFILCKYK